LEINKKSGTLDVFENGGKEFKVTFEAGGDKLAKPMK
jgi:hypothetical protein